MIAYPLMMSHDAEATDPQHFTCTAYTYGDLLHDESQFARAIAKAAEWIGELE